MNTLTWLHNFRDAEDIDLLVGGLSETATLGTVFGPTLTCLLAIQFANLRNSDRFWYENDLPPSSLNLPQLQAIRRVTLSGLLCEAKGVSKAQPKAFIREDPYLNARLNCEQISGLDVTPWRSETEEEVEEDVEEQTPTPPELAELNIDVIEKAIAKAKDQLIERKRFEYESWVNRKFYIGLQIDRVNLTCDAFRRRSGRQVSSWNCCFLQ